MGLKKGPSLCPWHFKRESATSLAAAIYPVWERIKKQNKTPTPSKHIICKRTITPCGPMRKNLPPPPPRGPLR